MKITSKIFYSKIARRIFILFISCALLPIVILTFLTFNQVTTSLREQFGKRLQHMAKSVGMSIYDRLLLLESNLKILAADVDPSAPSPAMINQTYKQQLSQWFDGIAFVNQDGAITPIFQMISPLPSLATDSAEFKKNNKTIIVTAEPEKAARIFMIKKIDPDKPAAGFLAAEINTSFLWGIGASNTVPQQTRMCVLDQLGRMLVCPFDGSLDIPHKVYQNLGEGNSRQFEFGGRDNGFIASSWSIFLRSNFSAPDWIVVLSQDKADVLAPLNHFRAVFPLVILLSFLIVLYLSIVYIRKSLVPLDDLKSGTERIANGDFSHLVEVRSDDEFAALAGSFNSMTDRLSRQFKTLKTRAEIDRAILSSLDTRIIVDTILNRVFDFLKCDLACIGLLEENIKEGMVFFVQERILGRVMHAQPRTISSRQQDELTARDFAFLCQTNELPPYLSFLAEHPAATFIIMPIKAGKNPAGVIVLGYNRETQASMEEEIPQATQMTIQMEVALANSSLLRELEELNWGAIEALARTVDAKSSWTAGHSERVTTYALQIAKAMNLPEERIKILHRAALLHDIGKIGIPLALLDKPASLSDEEYSKIKTHSEMGAKILEPINAFAAIRPIVRQHHENFDGSGYPDGLQGEKILLEARILSLADVFDALASIRPYREEWERNTIFEYLRNQSGIKFDPEIVKIFLHLLEKNLISANPLSYFKD